MATPLLSEEAYLAAERAALGRSEYLAGEVSPLPRSTNAHTLLSANISTVLTNVVRDRAWVTLGSTMRLYAPAGPLYTYPDAALVCEPVQLRADGYHDNLLNPALLVQVLPRQITDQFKRVFELYFSIPTVQHVLLVTQDAPRVSVSSRQPSGLLSVFGFAGLDAAVYLPDLDLELPLAEIYRKVPLPG